MRRELGLIVFTVLAACGRETPVSMSPEPVSQVTVPVARVSEVPVTRGSGARTVALLVDESGSMGGFGASLPELEAAVWRSVSRVRSYGFDMADRGACGFSAERSVTCAPVSRISRRTMRGSTNLDEAIQHASSLDLAIILTDGVAATGGLPSKYCSSGVDAACVGNRLATYLGSGESSGGVWLLTFPSQFDGTFYTERTLPAAEFDSARIEGVVEGTVDVLEAANLSSGELVYRYKGVRPLLGLVLAKDANLGRAFIAAFAASRATAGSSLPPGSISTIELFPGYVKSYRFSTSSPAQSMLSEVSHDVHLDAGSQTLRFTCGDPTQPRGDWVLAAQPAAPDVVARASLDYLPVTDRLTLNAPAPLIANAELRADRLETTISVDCQFDQPCGSSARLIGTVARNGSSQSLAAWSTDTPEYEPGKVFGLGSVVDSFYQKLGTMPPLVAAELNLCAGAS